MLKSGCPGGNCSLNQGTGSPRPCQAYAYSNKLASTCLNLGTPVGWAQESRTEGATPKGKQEQTQDESSFFKAYKESTQSKKGWRISVGGRRGVGVFCFVLLLIDSLWVSNCASQPTGHPSPSCLFFAFNT